MMKTPHTDTMTAEAPVRTVSSALTKGVPPVNATVSVITPELAKEMLANNTRNRPLSEAQVKLLMSEMSGGRWKFNGDAIRFAGKVLIDGQHRLEACVRSGVPFTTLVVSGLTKDVFDTIDTNRVRTAGDVLAIKGEENPAKLAATLRFVEMYETHNTHMKSKMTNTQIEEILKKHPKVRESLAFCDNGKKPLAPISVLAACHYVFKQKDQKLADQVVQQIATGVGLKEGDPIHTVRERLVQNSLTNRRMSPEYIAAILMKAWNQVRTGKKTKLLTWRGAGDKPEAFPEAA